MRNATRSCLLWIALAALGMFVSTEDVSAQARRDADRVPRAEVWGAVTGIASGPAGVLTTSYSPPLLFDGDFTSHAGQTFHADAGFAVGFSGGVNVFPTAHVGFQILLDRASRAATGSNTPYTLELQYTSRQPPDNQAQIVPVNESFIWPDTTGTLTQLTVAFNAVVRLGRPNRLAVTISGGPSYYRLSGAVQPLAYTTFRLGGHSVLFEDDYRLKMSANPTGALGFDVGAELNAPVARHVALVAGYRYLGGPAADVPVGPTAILNADQVFAQQALGDIASRLAPASMRVSVSGSRVLLGVKVMLP